MWLVKRVPTDFQLVLEQCCKDKFHVFVARLTKAYTVSVVKFAVDIVVSECSYSL